MQVKDCHPAIGREFTGVDAQDLARAEVWDAVTAAVFERELAVVRGVTLTPTQQIELARKLGTPVPFVITKYRHPEYEEIMISSNEVRDEKPVGVARVGNFWHQDSTFVADPAPFTMLHGVNVPSTTGHTEFASAIDVYNRLPEEWKARLADRIGVHTVAKRLRIRPEHLSLSPAEFKVQAEIEHPPVRHPMIRKDPYTSREYVYGSREYMEGVVGFDPNGDEEFFSLLDRLIMDEEHVYTHVWTQNDLLIWKTQTTYHIATEVTPGVPRTLHRISIDTPDAKPEPLRETVQ